MATAVTVEALIGPVKYKAIWYVAGKQNDYCSLDEVEFDAGQFGRLLFSSFLHRLGATGDLNGLV